MNHAPIPHKETLNFNNKAQIYKLNIITKFKPTINSGSPVRKHFSSQIQFIDSILLTSSNPLSIVVLLCLYKEWQHFPGYKLFVSLLSGIHRIIYVPLCVGRSKGKAGIQMWCIPERRDSNNLYPRKCCHSLYRHNRTTIDCGFEFVNNIESINLNLITKCFLTRKPQLIVGLNLLILSL